jgi:hypothetical protein
MELRMSEAVYFNERAACHSERRGAARAAALAAIPEVTT